MRVLFVRSGNVENDPITNRQAISLIQKRIEVELFSIKGKGLWGYVKNIFRLNKKIKEISPDIIHAHFGLSGIVAYLSSSGQKVIVSFMGDDIVGSNRKNGSITLISKLLARINIFFARNLYDHSIAKSEEIFKRINSKKVTLIPNGVDLKTYQILDKRIVRNQIGIQEETDLVIFASNPNRREKNYALAEKAIKLLHDPKILILCLWDKSQEELVRYYNAADLLLLTSFHEGSPNVVKEAMACCCPVVSTEVGDVKLLFADSPGYFIARFDPIDVAEKIKLAIQFRKKYKHTEGRKKIVEMKLDSGNVADKLIEVYEKVLNS
jgi:glycosyltransferase involved in cell wall biosynthesis